MVTHDFDGEPDDRPSRWPLHSDRVILETRMSNDVRTFDVNKGRVTYVETKVAEVQRRIRDFDVETKVARPRRLLDGLGADDRVNRIEDEIRAMDDPARSRELEERRDEALANLKRTLRFRE